MSIRYAIHPAIGIARVGNSSSFYLAPATIGGLPIECDDTGTMSRNDVGDPVFVKSFKKDAQQGRELRPQAARFAVYAHDDDHGTSREVTLDDADIASIEWTVHLANKKSCWYFFEQRLGDISLSPSNTYDANGVPPRNPAVTGGDRAQLIIDPGPRTVRDRGAHAKFTAAESNGYPSRFPTPVGKHAPVTTLGELRTDNAGRLLVIGGPGAAFGPDDGPGPFHALMALVRGNTALPPVQHGHAAEQPGWYDDAGDGPVVCTVTFKDPAKDAIPPLRAWCIVGPPKYAPELVSVVTLDDVMLDVAVQHLGLKFAADGVPDGIVVNYDRDIAPIIERCAQASWSHAVPSAAATGYPKFDTRDASEGNRPKRERYARLFRREPTRFFDESGVPMLPLHAGSDQVSGPRACFDTLTDTQLKMLTLWAAGQFTIAPAGPSLDVHPLDRASVGNCVGSPLDPGIEVTWSLRDPAIYEGPWRIKHRPPEDRLPNALSPDVNEQDGKGCEPGDLTKRLITPWQWDFAHCGVEEVALNDGDLGGLPNPPNYQVAWWPAQRPVTVIHGLHNDASLVAGAVVPWDRMADSAPHMLDGWTSLGFIVNQNSTDGTDYPYFAEVDRQDISSADPAPLARIATAFREWRARP